METAFDGGEINSNNSVMCLLTNPEGEPLGAPLYLPQNAGPLQLQQLVNKLHQNVISVAFFPFDLACRCPSCMLLSFYFIFIFWEVDLWDVCIFLCEEMKFEVFSFLSCTLNWIGLKLSFVTQCQNHTNKIHKTKRTKSRQKKKGKEEI